MGGQDIEGFLAPQQRCILRRGEIACDERAHSSLQQGRYLGWSIPLSALQPPACSPAHQLLVCKTMFELREQHPKRLTYQPLNYKVPKKAESSSRAPVLCGANKSGLLKASRTIPSDKAQIPASTHSVGREHRHLAKLLCMGHKI